MNLSFVLALLRGQNVFETISKILTIGAGFIAGIDADNKGSDDLISDICLSAADGLSAYGRKEYNQLGNLIDALIASLNRLKAQLVSNGSIVVTNDGRLTT